MSSGPTDGPAEGGVQADIPKQFVERGMLALDGVVPREQQEDVVRRVLQAATTVMVKQTAVEAQFSGYLPPPSMIAQYDRIHPGLADRIMAMAENDQRSQIAMVEDANRRTDRYQLLALGAGFVGLLCVLATATFLALHGQKEVALGALAIGVSGIIATLVNAPFGKRKKRLDEAQG
ncbi:hypothetical protein VQ02_20205 [Methylobacterium variabile]|uniref:DUF2335 domain-containing protein n=1 Tax=Methylobacterium variabile TaxID=298794 RepID=A0A0J6V4B3_9HYPH|nr:DUF2335 domain-containing protein [Methylobacterium variabile]KMO33731.1 hypothetical protein VQ02_20205 [Methylobacterium variabile]